MIPSIWLRAGLKASGLLLATSLAACSSLLPGKPPSPDLYKLPPPALGANAAPVGAKAAGLQLLVDMPVAARALDTDRIAVRTSDYAFAYLAGARWNDNAPRIVQQRLIETFEQAGVASGVGRAEDGMRGDMGFVSDLRAFEVETHALKAPVVNVRIAAKLVTRPLGEVRASRIFEAQVKAEGRSEDDIVAAFDQALNAISTQAAAWVRTALPAT